MTFKRLTARAKRIVAWLDAPIGKELAVLMVTNGTLDAVATIDKPKDFQSYTAYELKVPAWNKPDKNRDEPLHGLAKIVKGQVPVACYLLLVISPSLQSFTNKLLLIVSGIQATSLFCCSIELFLRPGHLTHNKPS